MADFRMALQALGKGRVDDVVLRNQIRKLLKVRPNLAEAMLRELKQSHEKQEIGREVFISLQEYIGSCAGGGTQTELPQGGGDPDPDPGRGNPGPAAGGAGRATGRGRGLHGDQRSHGSCRQGSFRRRRGRHCAGVPATGRSVPPRRNLPAARWAWVR